MAIKIVVDSLEEFSWINNILRTGCLNASNNLKEYFKENNINSKQVCDYYSSENFTVGDKIKEHFNKTDIDKLSKHKAKLMEIQG